MPLFALANAGVPDHGGRAVGGGVVADHLRRRRSGSSSASRSASPRSRGSPTRLGIGELPPGATWSGIVGVGALAGIGFTVSLFVTGLAFDDVVRQDEAKIGILVASTIAAVLGSLILSGVGRRSGRNASARPAGCAKLTA